MSGGSNLVAVKKELFRRLAAAPELASVQVSYTWRRDFGREVLYGGKARFDHELAAMRGSRPRLPRDERVTLMVFAQVRNMASDAEAADERAMSIGTVVEELLAAEPTLSGFPNLLFAGVAGGDLIAPEFDDDGVTSAMAMEIGYRSRLS